MVFVMPTLAVGAVALANVFFLLLDKHAVAGNGHVKAALALEDNALCAEPAQKQGCFEGVDGRGVGVGYVPHVDKNSFAVGLIALKKLNKSIGLGRIKTG